MNTTLKQIKPETIALIEAQSKHSGLSIDEYLRRLLLTNEPDLALKPDAKDDEFESDMIIFSEGAVTSSEYNGTYSREDIYFDHD